MVKKENLEGIERIVSSYEQLKGLSEAIDEDPWRYKLRELLGLLRKGDKEFYSETGPDAVRKAADIESDKARRELEEKVSYADLVRIYDADKLKSILAILPPLKEDGYGELAKAHKEYYEAVQEWKTGLKLMEKDPEAYKWKIASEAKDEADRYLARGRDESTRKVAYGKILEATRKFYQIVDELKGKKK